LQYGTHCCAFSSLKGRQLEEDTIQFETLEATKEVGKSDAAIALARTPWQGIRNSISAKYTRRVNLQDVGVGKLQQFLARYGCVYWFWT
jgi:hypothetical protein